MDHRVSLGIILVIVVVLEIFLLTTGKIFWIVNAALLVSFTAIGMIWKEEWKMTLSRYHWTASGPQVWEETFGRRVSFLAEGLKRDSEEAHLLKTVPSGGAWRSEDEGEETLLTSL